MTDNVKYFIKNSKGKFVARPLIGIGYQSAAFNSDGWIKAADLKTFLNTTLDQIEACEKQLLNGEELYIQPDINPSGFDGTATVIAVNTKHMKKPLY